MAEDLEPQTDFSVGSAANAIEALLNRQPEQEALAVQPELESQPSAVAQPTEVETPVPEPEQQAEPETPATEAKPVSQPQPKSSPELETARAAAQKMAQEAQAARDRYVNTLNTLVPQLEAQIKGEFADIKSKDDLYALADPRSPHYNVERYNSAIIAFSKLNDAIVAREAATSEQRQQEQTRFTEWQRGEQQKLGELIPDLNDPNKGPGLAKKLHDFATKDRGYTSDQLARASAQDFALLYDAMRYRDSQAAIETAKAKAAKAPPVQAPGTVRSTSSKDEKINSDFQRLQKSGRVDDAAAVFRNLMN